MNLKESKSQQELWKKLLLYKESKSNSNKVRLKKLDGVRGILALLVVFFHFEAVYLPDIYSKRIFSLYKATCK